MICGGFFDVDKKKSELDDLRSLTTDENFWNDPSKAQKITSKISKYENTVREYERVKKQLDDAVEFFELSELEDDAALLQEVENILIPLSKKVEKLNLKSMLNGEDDDKNAILTIHPGAGGTESQDWADMLLRMYLRYTEQADMKSKVIDLIKSLCTHRPEIGINIDTK